LIEKLIIEPPTREMRRPAFNAGIATRRRMYNPTSWVLRQPLHFTEGRLVVFHRRNTFRAARPSFFCLSLKT
jgi:hypothetical protein